MATGEMFRVKDMAKDVRQCEPGVGGLRVSGKAGEANVFKAGTADDADWVVVFQEWGKQGAQRGRYLDGELDWAIRFALRLVSGETA